MRTTIRSFATLLLATIAGTACSAQVRDFSGSGAGSGGSGGEGVASASGVTATSGETSASAGPGGGSSVSTGAGTDCEPPLVQCVGKCADLAVDPDHCGACGHSCQGGACEEGRCQPVVLAARQGAPYDLAVDARDVYWTNKGARTVMSVPIAGGTPTTLATGQMNAESIAIDANNVYWVTISAPNSFLNFVPLRGGSPGVLYNDANVMNDIAVYNDRIFLADYSGTGAGTISVLNRPTGAIPTPITTGAMNPRGIATDGTRVYWTNYYGGDASVSAFSADTTIITRLATGQAFPYAIAVDSRNVYWSNLDDGTIMSIPIGGGSLSRIADRQGRVTGIASDGAKVYWVDPTNGTVMSAPVGSGPVEVVADGQDAPARVAVDATTVYWINGGAEGAVMKLAK